MAQDDPTGSEPDAQRIQPNEVRRGSELPAAPTELRRRFERAARDAPPNAELYRAAAERLLEHLGPIKLEPRTALDLGSGLGTAYALVQARYPRAACLALDFALPRIRTLRPGARRRAPRWLAGRRARRGRPAALCADARALPLTDASVDLVVSNLLVHWLERLGPLFEEARRVLRPGGLLMLSALGADTLKELRSAWAEVDTQPHLHVFPDMHDLADAMVRAGLLDAVTDAERVTLTYPGPRELLQELHGMDVGNLCPGRPRGLLTPSRLEALGAAYRTIPEAVEPASGRIRATVELVFAHAWCPPAEPVAGTGSRSVRVAFPSPLAGPRSGS